LNKTIMVTRDNVNITKFFNHFKEVSYIFSFLECCRWNVMFYVTQQDYFTEVMKVQVEKIRDNNL